MNVLTDSLIYGFVRSIVKLWKKIFRIKPKSYPEQYLTVQQVKQIHQAMQENSTDASAGACILYKFSEAKAKVIDSATNIIQTLYQFLENNLNDSDDLEIILVLCQVEELKKVKKYCFKKIWDYKGQFLLAHEVKNRTDF